MQPLIELDGIGKRYPMPGEDVHALRDLSLSINSGEFLSIVGSSGSGKTTLLYLLGMLTEATSGAYRFDGQDVAKLSDAACSALRGREIGFVFQAFHLLPQVTVLGNVLLSTRYAGQVPGGSSGDAAGGAAFRDKAAHLIERVGLGHRMGHRPRELSGGEMQRVAIARALLTEPRIILADEPTGNLDEKNGGQVFELLEGLVEEGTTVVVVTHDLALAGRTPRCVSLKDGKVVEDAVPVS